MVHALLGSLHAILSPTFPMLNFKHSWLALALAVSLSSATCASSSGVRVKDMAMVAGADGNNLNGYGLVSGLANDGDKNPIYTVQAVANMLQRFGVTIPSSAQTKNIAAVTVTAEIPAFAKPGTRLDIHVASMGDAKSLLGGVLLETPLIGADGIVYAVAQGPIALGGFSAGPAGGGGASVQKNHPTVGQIPGGARVVREIPATIVQNNLIELLLYEPDFTSASRMAAAINQAFTNAAHAVDASTVRVAIPEGIDGFPIDFIARVEAIELTPDSTARIIINERTGTVVANSRIQISPCAVAHGNLTITVASTLDVSQPNPLAERGQTIVTDRTSTNVREAKATLITLPELPTVERVAAALNSLGVTPRDMMTIFQAMKQAGALQAELLSR